MTTPLLLLPPHSPFSKEIYKRVRPRIPRHFWPPESVRVSFQPSPDGLFLDAVFEGLPAAYAKVAAATIRETGSALVLESPAATLAAMVFKARRRRDIALFCILPLLFAVPLLGHFNPIWMRPAIALFVADVVALAFLHVALIQRRANLAAGRFLADIPVPGLHIAPSASRFLPIEDTADMGE